MIGYDSLEVHSIVLRNIPSRIIYGFCAELLNDDYSSVEPSICVRYDGGVRDGNIIIEAPISCTKEFEQAIHLFFDVWCRCGKRM